MSGSDRRTGRRAARLPLLTGIATAALALPAMAFAHSERPSYWPVPGPDTSVSPPTGGKVPRGRSLDSAVTGRGPGEVRVVCRDSSLARARQSISSARSKGFRLRPSQPKTKLGALRAEALLAINRELFADCDFSSVQKAIDASGNNDRVVIMPGRYTEQAARKEPTNDPACYPELSQPAEEGGSPSYEYQATCPHDQNLILVQGREVVGEPLWPPRDNRQGIPEQELGDCVRCNLQIEGSGPKPDDVILDAGKNYNNPLNPDARPGGGEVCDPQSRCYAKDIVLRVDRADGFVGRNFLVRGAREFGFYAEESDGVLLNKMKFFWAADYGHLSFTTDHAAIKNCDAYGAGDAAIYPGASPETGAQADTSFYPDAPRINTVVKRCDMRGSDLGFSGSMGNATRITRSHIYGNVSGIVLDTISSAGHPGYPADSSKIDHNLIYSNNLDLFVQDPPAEPVTQAPMGTGIVYGGMNSARVHDNWIFDNWRNGTMLIAVPDAATTAGGPEGQVNDGVACPGYPENNQISTSCDNQFFDNDMGQAPPGFKFPPAIDQYDLNAHGTPGAPLENGNLPLPNGIDFWWDEFLGNIENCWYDNTGVDGTPASVTGSGEAGQIPGVPPNLLPSNCDTSVGNGDPAKEQYLLSCADGPPRDPDTGEIDHDAEPGPLDCDWWYRPEEPGSAKAKQDQRQYERAAARFAQSPEGQALAERMEALVE